ncbi:COMPASS (complex proteins associated with Set1p) component [Taxawa tesnikishii (nom. ined.)]|nr:COMPASS (complex proteins associated with Set1p) component [Dothideales sp. JES 119]
MSFSLSSLLNPAPNSNSNSNSDPDSNPAGDTSNNQRSSSDAIPPLQLPQQQTTTKRPQRDNPGTLSQIVRDDAAHALAALSASSAPPPTSWNGYSNDLTRSPTESRSVEPAARSSEARRGSTFGYDGTFLPEPTMGRKMSSPSLEQYHMSKSPEQQRRASFAMNNDQAFTLPPLQPMTSPSSCRVAEPSVPQNGVQELGRDTSYIVGTNAVLKDEPDTAQRLQQIAEEREPSYTREEPTISQIRQPSIAAGAADQGERPPNNSERSFVLTNTDSPLPMKPIAAMKGEYSAYTQSPLRESSIPIPSTEMVSAETTAPKKRAAPKGISKKGTASAVKKEPAAKKRKTATGTNAGTAAGTKRSDTPSSQKSKSRGTGSAINKKAPSASGASLNGSPAPRSVRTASTPPRSSPSARSDGEETAMSGDEEEEEEEEEQGTPDPDAEVYCICRKPDTGTFMIGCDGPCEDWFHGKCVGISEKNRNLIDRYICPNCKEEGHGDTTFKRMCRRPGCRMPARLVKKGKGDTSKYCSDECGAQFFREMVANKTRGFDTTSTKKTARKKSSASIDVDATKGTDDDLGPRGGILSAGELKALVEAAPSMQDFGRLGEGVLSPPTTPPSKNSKGAPGESAQPEPSIFNDAEAERLAEIASLKDEARIRHALLRDRTKFITMVKQAGARIAEEKDMKPKEMCGYDSRIGWTESQFAAYRATTKGSEALQLGTLEPGNDPSKTTDVGFDDGDDDNVQVCVKKRCQRHHDWSKLATDEVRFEISENSETMRGLEREEKEIKERAGLRAREMKAGGAGGSVELHQSEVEATDAAPTDADADAVMSDGGAGAAHAKDPAGAAPSVERTDAENTKGMEADADTMMLDTEPSTSVVREQPAADDA